MGPCYFVNYHFVIKTFFEPTLGLRLEIIFLSINYECAHQNNGRNLVISSKWCHYHTHMKIISHSFLCEPLFCLHLQLIISNSSGVSHDSPEELQNFGIWYTTVHLVHVGQWIRINGNLKHQTASHKCTGLLKRKSLPQTTQTKHNMSNWKIWTFW